MKGFVDIDIKKPMFDNFVYIYDKFIKQAEKENKYLRITIPNGTGVMSPKVWMKGAKKMEKIYKIAGVPMILWGNTVRLSQGSKYEIGDDGIARLKVE